MSFISVLFALLLEQARPLQRGNAVHAAMRAWVRWCARNLDAGERVHGWLAWSAAVGLPSALVLGIYWLLQVVLGWPVALLWSALVLYASLGFRQFSFHFTRIRDALVDGDDALARRLLDEWHAVGSGELKRSDLVGRVMGVSVLAAHRHVFGVLAWFTVLTALGLGPTGAVFYRLSEFVARYWRHHNRVNDQAVSAALQSRADQVWQLVDWAPARLTAISFAVVGNFEEAIDGWRRYAQGAVVDNDGLVLAATAGAINVDLHSTRGVNVVQSGEVADQAGEAHRAAPDLPHLAVVVGLVWRTVVMWVVLLAILTLARLMG